MNHPATFKTTSDHNIKLIRIIRVKVHYIDKKIIKKRIKETVMLQKNNVTLKIFLCSSQFYNVYAAEFANISWALLQIKTHNKTTILIFIDKRSATRSFKIS